MGLRKAYSLQNSPSNTGPSADYLVEINDGGIVDPLNEPFFNVTNP